MAAEPAAASDLVLSLRLVRLQCVFLLTARGDLERIKVSLR